MRCCEAHVLRNDAKRAQVLRKYGTPVSPSWCTDAVNASAIPLRGSGSPRRQSLRVAAVSAQLRSPFIRTCPLGFRRHAPCTSVSRMDEKTRKDANARLKRVAGQVAGVERMLAEDRYCVDVLLQIAAIQGALTEVGRVVLANHVRTCLAGALKTGNTRERLAKVEELMEVLSRCNLGVGGRTRAARKVGLRG